MEEERQSSMDEAQELEDITDKEQENLSMIVPNRFQIFFNKLRAMTIDKFKSLGQRFSEWNEIRKQDALNSTHEIMIRSGEMKVEDRLINQLKADLSLEEQSKNAIEIQQRMSSMEVKEEIPKEQIKEAEGLPEIHDEHEEK